MLVVETRELTKVYDNNVLAVNRLNLRVRKSEIFGLLGPNGAGKTTTISMLTTILKPTSGRAYVLGYDIVKEKEEIRRSIILVPQELAIDLFLTVFENLYMHAWILGIPKSERKRVVNKIIESFGLKEHKNKLAAHLSGGLKRRLQLARAFLVERDLIFLDEPTLGIDIKGKIEAWTLIKNLVEERGATVFMATNDLYEAERLCTRIGIIYRGELIMVGSPSELKEMSRTTIAARRVRGAGRALNRVLDSYLSDGHIEDYHIDLPEIKILFKDFDALASLISELKQTGAIIEDLEIKKASLEEIFMKLVKGRGEP